MGKADWGFFCNTVQMKLGNPCCKLPMTHVWSIFINVVIGYKKHITLSISIPLFLWKTCTLLIVLREDMYVSQK